MRTYNINGILVIDKPVGMTSHDVVNRMRKITGIRRIGHAGTLDPIATGVLPICIGNATKVTGMLQDADKVYRAQIVLGMTTDTYDCEGEVITECEVKCTREEIIDAILSFQGEIEQIPPMYSAIKQDGKKLYELARKGIEIDRKPRKVKISAVSVLNIDMENYVVDVEFECSKGTYIRSLCDDIGRKLGVGAYMNQLRRIKSHSFAIEESYKLEDIEQIYKERMLQTKLINVDKLFPSYPKLYLNQRQTERVTNGCRITWPDAVEGQYYRLYNSRSKFLCISQCINNNLVLRQSFWTYKDRG